MDITCVSIFRLEVHCHASRSKSLLAGWLSAESCFTVKASEPESMSGHDLAWTQDHGNAAGHEPKQKACTYGIYIFRRLSLASLAHGSHELPYRGQLRCVA